MVTVKEFYESFRAAQDGLGITNLDLCKYAGLDVQLSRSGAVYIKEGDLDDLVSLLRDVITYGSIVEPDVAALMIKSLEASEALEKGKNASAQICFMGKLKAALGVAESDNLTLDHFQITGIASIDSNVVCTTSGVRYTVAVTANRSEGQYDVRLFNLENPKEVPAVATVKASGAGEALFYGLKELAAGLSPLDKQFSSLVISALPKAFDAVKRYILSIDKGKTKTIAELLTGTFEELEAGIDCGIVKLKYPKAIVSAMDIVFSDVIERLKETIEGDSPLYPFLAKFQSYIETEGKETDLEKYKNCFTALREQAQTSVGHGMTDAHAVLTGVQQVRK